MIHLRSAGLVFIKTSKTAGTAIEIGLSTFAGAGDVLTPISPEDEEIRRRTVAEHGGVPAPQNFRHTWRDVAAMGPGALAIALRRRTRPLRFHNHMSAVQARAAMTAEEWDASVSFAVERNPFDRIVSYYFWTTRGLSERPDFGRWFRSSGFRSASQRDYYTDGDQQLVDHVIKYEDLEAGLAGVLRGAGLPMIPLPQAKGGVRPAGTHWREVIPPAERDVIAYLCAEEIERFGYAW